MKRITGLEFLVLLFFRKFLSNSTFCSGQWFGSSGSHSRLWTVGIPFSKIKFSFPRDILEVFVELKCSFLSKFASTRIPSTYKEFLLSSNRNINYEIMENKKITASSKWAWWIICRSNFHQIKLLGRSFWSAFFHPKQKLPTLLLLLKNEDVSCLF